MAKTSAQLSSRTPYKVSAKVSWSRNTKAVRKVAKCINIDPKDYVCVTRLPLEAKAVLYVAARMK